MSAAVEPDTVILSRSWKNELKVKEAIPGKKNVKLSMNQTGTSQVKLTDNESSAVSITNETAIELGKLGLQLEAVSGVGKDIEWAVIGNDIYLLQSRPITTLDSWTDFELTHELDTCVPNATDICTFANVGEVFPGAISPLAMSTIIAMFNGSITINIWNEFRAYSDHMHITAMRCSINYLNVSSSISSFIKKKKRNQNT